MVRRFSDAVFIPRLHNADNNSNNKGDNKDVSLEMNHSRDWESLTGKLIPNVFFCFPSSDILATTRKHNTPLDSSYGQFTNPPHTFCPQMTTCSSALLNAAWNLSFRLFSDSFFNMAAFVFNGLYPRGLPIPVMSHLAPPVPVACWE